MFKVAGKIIAKVEKSQRITKIFALIKKIHTILLFTEVFSSESEISIK
jgi:hypothetical protein